MSNTEGSPKPKLSLKNRAKRAGALAGIFALGAAAGAAVESGQQGNDQAAKTGAVPARIDMNEVYSNKAVNMFDGGQAVVKKADGSEVTIVNPILADNGAVVSFKRPEKPSSPGVAPLGPNNISVYTPGEDGVEGIDYYIVQYGATEEQYYGEMGQPIQVDAATAAHRAIPVEVEYTHGDSFNLKPISRSVVIDPTEPVAEPHIQPPLNGGGQAPNPSQLDNSQKVSFRP